MSYFVELGNSTVKISDAKLRGNTIQVEVAKTIFAIFGSDTIENISDEVGQLDGNPNHAQLIINNSAMTYKDIRIPRLDRRKTAPIVHNEMITATSAHQEILTSWMNVSQEAETDGLIRVLGCSLPEATLTSYLPLFRNIGCRHPRGIDAGYHTLMAYLARSPLGKLHTPYLAAELGTGFLRIFLIDQGSLVVVRNVRIQSDDSDSLVTEIREQVSLLQQFQAARRKDSKIDSTYLFGDLNGLEYLAESCGRDYPMSFECLPPLCTVYAPEGFNYLAYVYLLGAVVADPREVDFYQIEKDTEKARRAMDPSTRRLLIILLCLLIPMAGAEGYLLVKNGALKRQIQAEQEYITAPERLDKLDRINEQEQEISIYNEIYRLLKQTYDINDTYLPTISSDLVIPFYRYNGVSVQSFAFDSEKITVTCTTKDVNSPYYYVNYLQSTGLYQKVEYTGFQKSTTTGTLYEFTVSAVLYRGI